MSVRNFVQMAGLFFGHGPRGGSSGLPATCLALCLGCTAEGRQTPFPYDAGAAMAGLDGGAADAGSGAADSGTHPADGAWGADTGRPVEEPNDLDGSSQDAGERESDAGLTRELTLLVTNDDVVAADGIDLLVEELRKLQRVSVVVVAPATNRSASGGTLSNGPVQHETSATKSGYPAVAVHGYPADTIQVALEELGIAPDFVVAGTNAGVNAGILVDLSGTIGAARQAAKRGVAALAVSQEVIGEQSDFAASVKVAIDWFNANRGAIEAKTLPTNVIVNINAPTCASGTTMRGAVQVPLSSTAAFFPSDCASTQLDPSDDVTALRYGYAAVTTDLPVP